MSNRTRTIARAGSCCIDSGPRRATTSKCSWRTIRPGSSASNRPGSAARPSSRCTATTPRKRLSSISTIRSRRLGSSRRAGREFATRSWTTAIASSSAPTPGAPDFKIVVAPREAPQEANWRDFVAERDGRFIADATLFKDHLVLLTREMSRPRLVVIDLKSGESHEIAFDEETYFLRFEPVYEFDTSLIRFSYSSLARPQETYDYDVAKRRRTLVKRQTMPRGFDPQAYVTRLVFAPAEDGESVPVSLIHKRGLRLDGSAPLHAHRLRRLWLCGRGELLDQPFLARRPRLRVCDRPCARRHGQGLALVRGRQARQEAEHLPRFPRRRAVPDRRGLYRARGGSWRRAAAPGACSWARSPISRRTCSPASSPTFRSSTYWRRCSTPACR